MRAIVLEGIKGSGKSTTAKLLSERFGLRLLREPGGTSVGEQIRQLLIDHDLSIEAQICLYMASRKMLVDSIVEDEIVVLDRYYHSSMVYQHSRIDMVDAMIKLLVLPEPMATFVIDVDATVASERLLKRDGKIANETELRCQRFDYMCLTTEPNVFLVGGEKNVDDVVDEIAGILVNQYGVKELMK